MKKKVVVTRCSAEDKIDFSKPPVGKVYVAIPTDEDDIKRCGIDRRYVVKHTYSATTVLCKMVLIDEEAAGIANSYINDIKTEYQQDERKGRCKIRSPKTGRKITCPYSCYGEECPKKKGEEVEAEYDASIEYLRETTGFEIGGMDSTSNTAISNVMREEFVALLKKEDPVLARIFVLRDCGFKPEEIMEKLNMVRSTYFYQVKRIRDRWKKYNAD